MKMKIGRMVVVGLGIAAIATLTVDTAMAGARKSSATLRFYAQGGGKATGTMAGFRNGPNASDQAYFEMDAYPFGSHWFYVTFNGKSAACVFDDLNTTDQIRVVSSLVNNAHKFFAISWDADGHCQDVTVSQGSYY